MKYSLRSLMIVVTLLCVVIGGRLEYLRRWAIFHESEPKRLLATFNESPELSVEWQAAGQAAVQHRFIAERFRNAVYRPWVIVDDPPLSLEIVPVPKGSLPTSQAPAPNTPYP